MSRDLENSPKDVQLAYENPSRRVMTSGNKEDVPDNSVFLYYLLDKLKSNKEKYLLADNLFNAIKPAVVNNSRGLPLHEVIYDTGDQGGDFVFIKK